MPATLTTRRPETTVGMGQIALLTGDERASSVLGSCVGVALYDDQKKLGALAHIVLPSSAGRPGTPGKFVDTAIVWMINELRLRGADVRKLKMVTGWEPNWSIDEGVATLLKEDVDL